MKWSVLLFAVVIFSTNHNVQLASIVSSDEANVESEDELTALKAEGGVFLQKLGALIQKLDKEEAEKNLVAQRDMQEGRTAEEDNGNEQDIDDSNEKTDEATAEIAGQLTPDEQAFVQWQHDSELQKLANAQYRPVGPVGFLYGDYGPANSNEETDDIAPQLPPEEQDYVENNQSQD